MKQIRNEFIYDEPLPVPHCHASTILKLGEGHFLAAWFGGTIEKATDVTIWASRFENGTWSAPKSITPPVGIPCWNPVLFQWDDGSVKLFYKLGDDAGEWKTMVKTTHDGGKTWRAEKELIEGDSFGGRGPVKNKPIRVSNGTILAPASVEERGPWRCFIDLYKDGKWEKKAIPVRVEEKETKVIQPTLWESPEGKIHALMRSKQNRIYRSDSEDYGETWCSMYPIDIPNNNSGIDCVLAKNGMLVLVCNPVENGQGRTPLSVFVSTDNGKSFQKELDLETDAEEYSYPAVIADKNHVYITYTWRRRKIVFCEIEL